ncbi:hypothetical protein [Planomicrobium okeanokoites]|uniref:EF-hand domain-containing protein n=1 Tax=Planomicrobium okeanokoites TaxID=244 RepID=A0ABV7KSH9_PLAOK|nr:hypothetical protein [Planomicrobium okeanokoites]TAA70033.1 hypothetical protein D2910_06140 [Planomicrobium okeanokoites]
MNKKEAAEVFETLKRKGLENFQPSSEFNDIHIILNKKYNEIRDYQNANLYERDLRFAIYLYDNLDKYFGFSERDASKDENWRFISLNILPNIIYDRWSGFHEARFYNDSRRMWLKSLWWYIYLSWQGSSVETFNILKNNTTDDLVQLVERPGSKGYRVELSRELMKQYSYLNKTNRNQLFRKVMKLNTARVKIIEPSLTRGGNEQYVKELFDYFDKNN